MKKLIPISICIGIVVVFLTACGLINGGDPSLDATKVALAVMQTSIAQGQSPQVEPQQPQVDVPVQPTYTMYPTYTQQAPPQEEQPQEATPTVTITPTVTQTATQGLLFLDVTKDNIEFACHLMGYPTTLTITVEMSDVDRGAALFWRLPGGCMKKQPITKWIGLSRTWSGLGGTNELIHLTQTSREEQPILVTP